MRTNSLRHPRWSRILVAFALIALLVPLLPTFSPASHGSPHGLPRAPTGQGSPRPAAVGFPTPIRHVIVVVLENEKQSSVLARGPFEKSLQAKYAYASSYYAICHPSAPNYLAMVSGEPLQCGSDAWNTYNRTNLADRLDGANRSWAGYDESMPTACDTTSVYPYAVKHNPFVYYSDIVTNATRCAAHVVSFSAWNGAVANNTVPNFAFITPNLTNDGHDTGARFADRWLSGWLSPLLNDSFSASSAFFVVYDESVNDTTGYNGSVGGNVYFTAVSPYAKVAYNRTTNATHYSLLTTVEWLMGVGSTGHNDSWTAYPPMKDLFQFPSPTNYSVTGRVLAATTRSPIEAGHVTVNGASATTNATGGFVFSLPNGSYNLTASAPGYRTNTTPLTVAGAPVTPTILLTAVPVSRYNLSGRVLVQATGAPLTGALVSLNTGATAVTGADGAFSWPLPNGTYVATASASGFVGAVDTARVAGSPVWANFSLAPVPPGIWRIAGTITSASNGTPVAGANVSTDHGSANTADARGNYEIWVTNGTYRLTVTAAGFVTNTTSVVVRGAAAIVNIGLQPAGNASSGNPPPSPPSHPASTSFLLVVSAVVGALVLLGIVAAVVWLVRARRR